MLSAIRENNLNNVKKCLNEQDTPEIYMGALRLACRFGFTEIVRVLLKDPRIHPESGFVIYDQNDAIKIACCNGHPDIVQLLLEDGRSNPGSENNYCIKIASQRGHSSIVKMLLKDGRCNTYVDESTPLKLATRFDHPEIYNMLDAHQLFDQFSIHKEISLALILKDYRDIVPDHKKKELDLFMAEYYKNEPLLSSLPSECVFKIFEY